MFKLICSIILLYSTFLFSADIEQNIKNFINENPGRDIKIWIFFKDKGREKDLSVYDIDEYLSEKAINRRSKITKSSLLKFSDYPVYKEYIDQIKAHVLEFRRISRWLNGISVTITKDQIKQIEAFDFVKEIRLMHTFKKPVQEKPKIQLDKSTTSSSVYSHDYGLSESQLEQIGVIELPDKGLSGKNVVIAMFDDGFNRYNSHSAFDSLKVLDTYDFVNDDSDVADIDASPREGFHGTTTLSTVGGYSPGNLIGSAYGASFLLAKTEIDADEIEVEEDNWVAGLEWAEAKGADIVTSSVGYRDWYTWEDMDGKTAVTTKATIIAEANGLIVVNSAGNEANLNLPNTLNAPADGEFVVTVGGVRSSGSYWSSSSYGPTSDGRIKPDVCALGSSVYQASSFSDGNYTRASGTSYSTPLVAGAIALLVEAFPDLTPPDVRTAIRKTASQSDNPDNFLGYGILNINAAYNYILSDSLPKPEIPDSPNRLFSSTTKVHYGVENLSSVKLTIYDLLGRQIMVFPKKEVGAEDYEQIDGLRLKVNGMYFYHIEGKNLSTGKKINKSGKLVYLK